MWVLSASGCVVSISWVRRCEHHDLLSVGRRAEGKCHKGVHREPAAETRPGGLQVSQVL